MKEYDQSNTEFVSGVSEPLSRWGGQWTEEKLDTFAKYVNAYLTIMNKYRDQYDWKLIYFDGFAGSGSRSETNNQSDLLLELFSEDILRTDELDLYQGAAERVLSIDQRGFNYNYFIDKDSASSNLLQQKLQSYETTDRKLEFRCSDANEQLQIMAQALKNNPKLRALVLLDPFGMQVNWESIASLEKSHTDLWILIPTGVIVNRLLDRKGKLAQMKTL